MKLIIWYNGTITNFLKKAGNQVFINFTILNRHFVIYSKNF
jgi:hypothetical protein